MKTILIVEDYKNQRILYAQELRQEGYNVISAVDAKEAFAKVQKQQPDIVIMDINTSRIEGCKTMELILSKKKRVPVVIHTAYNNHKDHIMPWYADAYIVKSSDLTELKDKIRELLTRTITLPPASIALQS